MSKKKGVTKSHSVNDVPIGMRPNNLYEKLEEGHFKELLGRLATPSYTRKSEGCLTTSNLDEENESKLRWMENNLREKDNEEQRQMRDEKKRRKDGKPFDSRNPPSTSPPGSPQRSNANLAGNSFHSYVTDDRKFDYIDAGGDGPEDVEMDDLSKSSEIKPEIKPEIKIPLVFTKGNIEETAPEWSDWTTKQAEIPFMGSSSLEDSNKVEGLQNEFDDNQDDPIGRSLRSRNIPELNRMIHHQQESPYGDSQYTRSDSYSQNTGKPGKMGSLGSSDCTSDTMSDGSVGANENLIEDHNDTRPDVFEYASVPSFPVYPPFDLFGQKGTVPTLERQETDSKFLLSKKRAEKKKQRATKGVCTVGQPGSGIEGVSVETASVDELAASIEGDDGQQGRRRQNNAKKERAAAIIGNQNGKAPAAAQSNKPQNPAGASSSMNKDSNKKSPNKKNKKGGSSTANNNNTTPANAEATAAPDAAAQSTAPAKSTAERTSAEDAEEEYLSADEGVSNNTATSAPSDVMIDGHNYRADSDDLSNLDKEVNREAEFVIVTKKKGSTSQNQRTGSTGKVERRGPPETQQPRRNSMEDSRMNKPPARHHPLPQNISLGDYLNEKKPETHTKAKVVPFKESKKKHERLESTADSEYMDANEEMTLPAANINEIVTPERVFSYADAAKKSAESSRENSPACTNQPSGTPGVSPSLPPTQTVEPLASEVISYTIPSNVTEDPSSSSAPVSMPENAGKGNDDATGLSFFFDEDAPSNSAEAVSQPNNAPVPTDNAFVLAVGGRTVHFARGMAVNAKPIDENHRALADIMIRRWNAFMNEGPAPVIYKPPVQA